MSFITFQYKKGYYINSDTYPDERHITALHSPSGYGGEQLGEFKSIQAAKIAITKHIDAALVAEFIKGYAIAALWSSNDESDESGGEPMDVNYEISDIAPQTMDAMKRDCASFVKTNKALITAYCKARADELRYKEYTPMETAGHDFWLTRNHHGAGFWDRGLGKLGDDLTTAAQVYGGVDLYVGDDGKIYG
jgi:hypothetical protein